ncbi:hypothetical protein FRC10_004663 [Ceratobasidium sp. 414]|nr:hypothetical protein FRC10_004663 [Ceratobasidium sp. 414]
MLVQKLATAAAALTLADSALARSYVIAGGGSAGLLLAVQLSADPKVTVTVLEAGYSGYGNPKRLDLRPKATTVHSRDRVRLEVPVDSSTPIKRHYYTGTERKGFGVRMSLTLVPLFLIFLVLRGSSAMNALIMHRSGKYEYDLWESLGNKGWCVP